MAKMKVEKLQASQKRKLINNLDLSNPAAARARAEKILTQKDSAPKSLVKQAEHVLSLVNKLQGRKSEKVTKQVSKAQEALLKSTSAINNARKARQGLTMVIQDMLKTGKGWAGENLEDVKSAKKILKDKLGKDVWSSIEGKEAHDAHAHLIKAKNDAVQARKDAHQDLRNSLRMGHADDRKFFQEPERVWDSSTSKHVYKVVLKDGTVRNLTGPEQNHYEKLIEARKAHQKAEKNLQAFETFVADTKISGKHKENFEAARNELDKANAKAEKANGKVEARFDQHGRVRSDKEAKEIQATNTTDSTEKTGKKKKSKVDENQNIIEQAWKFLTGDKGKGINFVKWGGIAAGTAFAFNFIMSLINNSSNSNSNADLANVLAAANNIPTPAISGYSGSGLASLQGAR